MSHGRAYLFEFLVTSEIFLGSRFNDDANDLLVYRVWYSLFLSK